MSEVVNNNTTLNLNITCYFLNKLDSPDVLTWYTTGGPVTKTINHFDLTKHHRKKVEITYLMVNRCKDVELQYKGENNKEHFGQLYLFF